MVRILLLSLFFVSCVYNVNLKHVDLTPLFTDNNSKLWVINKIIVDDRNIGPVNLNEQSVFVFYSSGKYVMCKLKNLGSSKVERGEFALDSEDSILELFSEKRQSIYFLTYISEDKLVLTPEDEGIEGFELIPFPEY